MWLMTQFGFFSVVQKPNESQLTIRSRTCGDLDRLRLHYLPQLTPSLAHAGTDYPWRATATHQEFAEALKRIAEDIDYSNFKSEVKLSLGKDRAKRYDKVWSALADIPEDLPEPHPVDTFDSLPWNQQSPSGKALAYGGVIVDPLGRVLLREVKNHFDGYAWTFAKGRPHKNETPRNTALREVFEETGVSARIIAPIHGEFVGGTTINRYFLMIASEDAADISFNNDETSELCWATFEDARQLIFQTSNQQGKNRDLAILESAQRCLPSPLPLRRPITRREDWKTRPMPALRSSLVYDRLFIQSEMARIYRGFLPYVMEEKWFSYYEDGVLYLYRSWTGFCVFRIYFSPVSDGWKAYKVEVNQHPEQYNEKDDQANLQLVEELIAGLFLYGPDEPTVACKNLNLT